MAFLCSYLALAEWQRRHLIIGVYLHICIHNCDSDKGYIMTVVGMYTFNSELLIYIAEVNKIVHAGVCISDCTYWNVIRQLRDGARTHPRRHASRERQVHVHVCHILTYFRMARPGNEARPTALEADALPSALERRVQPVEQDVLTRFANT